MNPRRYHKKPVVIEAVQLAQDNLLEVQVWCDADLITTVSGRPFGLRIHTLEGDHEAYESDWIIKGIAGEFYPCKREIFAATYESTGEGKDA